MNGYSWVSVTALFCYLFLLLTFLASKKREKVIRSFMLLMLIMILWAGGSVAMRTELWPSINFWHHVSVTGMMLVTAGYYLFVFDFLEEKNDRSKYFWLALHTALAALDCATCFFVPEPQVIVGKGATQFIYNYSWHIYLVAVFLLPCFAQLLLVIRRHCKGNHIAFQQLRPILYGIGIIVLGHLGATLPVFKGFPLDIISGAINIFFVFYALYKKRLFKMTVLLSRANYVAFSVAVGTLVSFRLRPFCRALRETLALERTAETLLFAAAMLLSIAAVYGVVMLAHNFVFVRRAQQLEKRIKKLGDDVSHVFSVADILQSMTDVILQTTHIDRMVVFIRQSDGDFRVEHTTNPLDEKGFYLRSDHPLVTYFTARGGCLTMQEFMRTTAYRGIWEQEKKLLGSLRAECFVPLRGDGTLVGIIVMPERKDHLPYRDGDLETACSAASVCACAVKEACVYERAVTEARRDKLTGLINRKFFLELLDREFERYKDTALALCLINVDDFKLYNQLYGTQEGDLALARIAGVLRSTLNDNCHAARIGGKEFALLLPGYDIYSAKLLAENLMEEITGINARNGGEVPRRLTVSAGICAAPYMASSAKELFRSAETAVYTAKRSGKNAVQIYSSEIFRSREQRSDYRSGYGENASTIYALTAAIDAMDHYTYQHSQNVSYYAQELARAAGMGEDLLEIVKEAGLLHDIGKIGIREDILKKPERLTGEEYELMKEHVENAVNIIRYLPSLDYVIPAVRSHHERYDGLGYPNRLAGEEIPILGRILCIADSFDAMTSHRRYRPAMEVDAALDILRQEAGKQFDPKLALTFIDLVKSGGVEIRGRNAQQEEES